MSSRALENPLILHLDAPGQVWSARARQSPRRSRLAVDDFVEHADLTGRVHVVGSRDNSELLVQLWKHRERFPDMQLFVATPRMVEHTNKTSEALTAIAHSQLGSPSQGGWHLFTEQDAIAYELAYLAWRKQLTEARSAELVKQHAIWPLVNFIASLNPASLGFWLGEIRDPRWYVNPEDPNSTAPLERYLGLWPKIQAALLTENKRVIDSTAGRRCHLTRSCWLPSNDHELSACELDDPRHFLVRILASRCPEEPVRGLIRASQLFTRFVRALWLSQLSGYALFDPRDFLWEQELTSFMEFAEASAR